MPVGSQTPELQIQPTNAEVKENTPKRSSLPKGVRILLYILITIVMTVMILLLTAVISLRAAVTRENIYNVITNTEFMTIKADDGNGNELSLYEIMSKQFMSSNIKADSLYKIIAQTDIENTLADYIYSYASFVLFDGSLDEIDSRTVINLFEKNISKIEAGLGTKLNDNDKESVEREIKGQSELFDKLSKYSIENSLGAWLNIIRFFCSVPGIIVMSVIIAAMIVLLFVVSKSVFMPLCLTGTAGTVIGLAGEVVLALVLTGNFIVNIRELSAASIVYQSAAGVLAPIFIRIMGYVLTAGIIFILISCIAKAIISSKKHN